MASISFYRKYKNYTNINQGDIFELTSSEIKNYLKLEVENNTKFIVLSNSCDLCHGGDSQYICIARLMSLEELKKKYNLSESDMKKLAQNLSKYNHKVYFLLPKKRGLVDSSIIKLDFNSSYPFSILKEIILKKRLCGIHSPYREKLGWAVGNLFNRVALEHDEETFAEEILSQIKI